MNLIINSVLHTRYILWCFLQVVFLLSIVEIDEHDKDENKSIFKLYSEMIKCTCHLSVIL